MTSNTEGSTDMERKDDLSLGLIEDHLSEPKTTVESSGAEEDSIDPDNELAGLKLIIVHTALCLGVFLVALDMNIIATAIPVITTQFQSINDVGWYGAAFMLALCSTQPLAGKVYTFFPKKLVFLSYLALFEVGSLVCALAPNSSALIAGRAIAGLGGSGIFGGGLIILATIVPLSRRAIWQGTMNCVYGIASIVGPLIGGALTEDVSWRWCFYINLPIGGFSAVIIFLILRVKAAATENHPLHQKLRGLDALGSCLLAGSIIMLLLPLQVGGIIFAWQSSQVIGLFIGSGVTMAIFIYWQLFLKDIALIPPSLFQNSDRNLTILCLNAFFATGPFQVVIYWLPIWFQAVLGVSPVGSAIRYLPTVLSEVLTSFVGLGIVTAIGYWTPFLVFGDALVSIGTGLLTTIHPEISDGHWIGYQILGGVGYAFALNLIHIGYQSSIRKDLIPIATSVALTVISTSCAIYLALGQTIFQQRLSIQLKGIVPDDLAQKIRSAGVTQLRSTVGTMDLAVVLRAYSDSIAQTFYLPTASTVIGFILACGLKWTSTKAPKTPKASSGHSISGDAGEAHDKSEDSEGRGKRMISSN